MQRHPIDSGFLADLVQHLTTMAGGRRTETVAREIAIDVSKYLYFAHREEVAPHHLIMRSKLTSFVSTLEAMGIRTLGIRTKLVYLRLAIQYYVLTREGEEDEELVNQRSQHAIQLLESVRGCVAVERAREDRQRLESFVPPSLVGVHDFLTSSRLSTRVALLTSRLQSGQQAATAEMEEVQLILAGRVMYRYVSRLGGCYDISGIRPVLHHVYMYALIVCYH